MECILLNDTLLFQNEQGSNTAAGQNHQHTDDDRNGNQGVATFFTVVGGVSRLSCVRLSCIRLSCVRLGCSRLSHLGNGCLGSGCLGSGFLRLGYLGLVDLRLVDLRLVDLRFVDLRLVDLRLVDLRLGGEQVNDAGYGIDVSIGRQLIFVIYLQLIQFFGILGQTCDNGGVALKYVGGVEKGS